MSNQGSRPLPEKFHVAGSSEKRKHTGRAWACGSSPTIDGTAPWRTFSVISSMKKTRCCHTPSNPPTAPRSWEPAFPRTAPGRPYCTPGSRGRGSLACRMVPPCGRGIFATTAPRPGPSWAGSGPSSMSRGRESPFRRCKTPPAFPSQILPATARHGRRRRPSEEDCNFGTTAGSGSRAVAGSRGRPPPGGCAAAGPPPCLGGGGTGLDQALARA